MKIAGTIGLLLATFLSSGCASLIVHCSDPPAGERYPKYIYSGTLVSADEIDRAWTYMRSPGYGCDAFDPLWPYVWGFMVLDFPLTMVADTLFLPYDAFMVTLGGRDRYVFIEKEPAPASCK